MRILEIERQGQDAHRALVYKGNKKGGKILFSYRSLDVINIGYTNEGLSRREGYQFF